MAQTASHVRAGDSLVAFGCCLMAGTLALNLFRGALVVGLSSVLVVVLAGYIKTGQRVAVKWAMGVMVLYLLSPVALVGFMIAKGQAGAAAFADRWVGSSGLLSVQRRPIAWSLGIDIPASAWAAVNLVLLRRALVELRSGERIKLGQCPDCGYDLRGTRAAGGDKCPECGRPTADLPVPEAEVVVGR
jgi:hypothetical protein